MRKNVSLFIAILFAIIVVFCSLLLTGCACKHEYEKSTTPPTCTEEGYTTYVCTKCGDTYKDDVVEPLGHNYNDIVTAPTCTAEGYTTHTCQRCNNSYTDAQTTALGHDYTQSILLEATSTREGIYKYTCTRCNNQYTENYSMPIMTSQEIYALASKSVGEVTTYDEKNAALAAGSCFVISEDGKIVTNFHVIDEAYAIKITIDGKTYNVVSVLACDEDIDLAVLKINATGLTPVKMLKETPLGGWTVYAVGNPKGYSASLTSGVISSPNRVVDGVNCIQHDASISSGSSGGPLYNVYGEVLGVNAFSRTDANNINFAISIKELDNLDYSHSMSMSEFYDEYGPYFTTWIYDYIVNERESNNSRATAQIISVNGTTISGSVNKSDDIDYYKITIGAGKSLTAWLVPEYVVDASGMWLVLVDSDLNIIAEGDEQTIGSTQSVVMYYTNRTSSAITFYVVVTYYSGYTYENTVGNYDLFIYVK